MKKQSNITITGAIVIAFLIFIAGMVAFFIWQPSEIPSQIVGALFGVLVSAVVTMLLLSAQTRSEEEHEVSGKIFDKKTEAYLQILDSLEKIISDGKVDTIRDNRLDGKKDEFSELLFAITRLSSFVEKKNGSEKNGMEEFIKAVTCIIKTTTDENTRLPGYDSKEFWNGSGKKKPNETQKVYYLSLAESLANISSFAAENIRRGSSKNELDIASLKEMIEKSGLFPDDEEVKTEDNAMLSSGSDSTPASGSTSDYRIDCIADFLRETEKQLEDRFGKENVGRTGEGGDNTYWGRWKDTETTPELIAGWLLDRKRRSFIGYRVTVDGDFAADFYLAGDAQTLVAYIYPVSEKAKALVSSKYDAIKEKFGPDGWWVPADLDWILGGTYGGDYNGSPLSFDFRNSVTSESEYRAAYEKFSENAIEGVISGRDDSIVKTVEELKKLIFS